MVFTEEDVPLMKLIFNPSTHEMGMMLGRERAEEIFDYVSKKIYYDKEILLIEPIDFFERIFKNEYLCDFFWDNNILQISLLNPYSIYRILVNSPIGEKIYYSNKLDISKLSTEDYMYLKRIFQ